jgi:hypothetical protein
MCLIHPGQKEAEHSVLSAVAEGVGEEVTIRIIRVTVAMRANDKLIMKTNSVKSMSELHATVLLCKVREASTIIHRIAV